MTELELLTEILRVLKAMGWLLVLSVAVNIFGVICASEK